MAKPRGPPAAGLSEGRVPSKSPRGHGLYEAPRSPAHY